MTLNNFILLILDTGVACNEKDGAGGPTARSFLVDLRDAITLGKLLVYESGLIGDHRKQRENLSAKHCRRPQPNPNPNRVDCIRFGPQS
jgi:hypothetical protein